MATLLSHARRPLRRVAFETAAAAGAVHSAVALYPGYVRP
jgi:hypothetical protein